jgi:phosphoserine phosphatase
MAVGQRRFAFASMVLAAWLTMTAPPCLPVVEAREVTFWQRFRQLRRRVTKPLVKLGRRVARLPRMVPKALRRVRLKRRVDAQRLDVQALHRKKIEKLASVFKGTRMRLVSEWIEPKALAKLSRLVRRGKRGPACFDADGTLWKGDTGFGESLEKGHQAQVPGFFPWVLAKLDKEGFRRSKEAKRLINGYIEGRHREALTSEALYDLAVLQLSGLKEERLWKWAAEYVDQFVGPEVFMPMQDLVAGLAEQGFTPWIVSGGPYWVVAAAAEKYFGISRDRVIGLRLTTDSNGVLKHEIAGKRAPWKEGKREWIERKIGQRPVISVGNSRGDWEMLDLATDLALMVNPEPRCAAKSFIKRWTVQHLPDTTLLGTEFRRRWLMPHWPLPAYPTFSRMPTLGNGLTPDQWRQLDVATRTLLLRRSESLFQLEPR